MGVRQKVFVQLGPPHLHKPIALYLEHETTNGLLSERITPSFTKEGEVQAIELMVRGPAHSEFKT